MYKEATAKLDNTVFEARTDENGKVISYRITPLDGYKLHEITLDENVTDEYGNATGEIKQGFTTSYITAGADYDFEKNEREIYTQKEVL